MQYAQAEILLQSCGQYLYITAFLHRHCALIKIGVVLYVFHAGTQVCFPALDVQLALHTCAKFLIHIVIVPIIMVGVIMTHVERGESVAYIASCIEVYGVFPKAEVQVEVGIDAKLSERLVHDAYFTIYVIMQRFALAFGKFAAHE